MACDRHIDRDGEETMSIKGRKLKRWYKPEREMMMRLWEGCHFSAEVIAKKLNSCFKNGRTKGAVVSKANYVYKVKK